MRFCKSMYTDCALKKIFSLFLPFICTFFFIFDAFVDAVGKRVY